MNRTLVQGLEYEIEPEPGTCGRRFIAKGNEQILQTRSDASRYVFAVSQGTGRWVRLVEIERLRAREGELGPLDIERLEKALGLEGQPVMPYRQALVRLVERAKEIGKRSDPELAEQLKRNRELDLRRIQRALGPDDLLPQPMTLEQSFERVVERVLALSKRSDPEQQESRDRDALRQMEEIVRRVERSKDRTIERLKQAIERLTDEVRAKQEIFEQQKKRADLLQQEVDQIREQGRGRPSRAALEQLKRERAELTGERDALHERFAEIASLLGIQYSLHDRSSDVMQAVELLESDRKLLQQELERLRARWIEIDLPAFEELRRRHGELHGRVSELNRRNAELEREASHWRAEAGSQKRHGDERAIRLEARVAELTGRTVPAPDAEAETVQDRPDHQPVPGT